MIKLKIKNGEKEVDIRFPISDNNLYSKLTEIGECKDWFAAQRALVAKVYWPEELSVLEGRKVNLDEMNYLAKRLESFDTLEMDQFLIGITKLDEPSLKNLINLTFNLDHFTLAQDISSYGKIGRAYVMNTEGAVPIGDEDDPKYAAIGKDLIDRGLTQITAKGLLIYNPDDELKEVYDGQTFPPYYDRSDFVISAMLEYNGRQELLMLPEEDIAIEKAVTRLGASGIQDCAVHMDTSPLVSESMMKKLESWMHCGLYDVNAMLSRIDFRNMDWDKLAAAAELADVQSASQIVVLAEHLDDFKYYPSVSDEEELAHYLVDNVEEYSMNPVMEDYFDFAGFGGQFAEENEGQFVNGGFAYIRGGGSIDEWLGDIESEEESLTFGGM